MGTIEFEESKVVFQRLEADSRSDFKDLFAFGILKLEGVHGRSSKKRRKPETSPELEKRPGLHRSWRSAPDLSLEKDPDLGRRRRNKIKEKK